MGNTPDILKKIVARKHEEIAERADAVPIGMLRERLGDADPPRGFVAALQARVDAGAAALFDPAEFEQDFLVVGNAAGDLFEGLGGQGVVELVVDPAHLEQALADPGPRDGDLLGRSLLGRLHGLAAGLLEAQRAMDRGEHEQHRGRAQQPAQLLAPAVSRDGIVHGRAHRGSAPSSLRPSLRTRRPW